MDGKSHAGRLFFVVVKTAGHYKPLPGQKSRPRLGWGLACLHPLLLGDYHGQLMREGRGSDARKFAPAHFERSEPKYAAAALLIVMPAHLFYTRAHVERADEGRVSVVPALLHPLMSGAWIPVKCAKAASVIPLCIISCRARDLRRACKSRA